MNFFSPSGKLAAPGSWLGFFQRYLLFTAVTHLIWELAHMPLYTLWYEADTPVILYSVLHCTLGDVLIAQASLMAVLLLAGTADWPGECSLKMAALIIGTGLVYTFYSEWHNVYVLKSWTYAGAMPVLPPFGIGLSPLLQWLFLPAAGLWLCRPQENGM